MLHCQIKVTYCLNIKYMFLCMRVYSWLRRQLQTNNIQKYSLNLSIRDRIWFVYTRPFISEKQDKNIRLLHCHRNYMSIENLKVLLFHNRIERFKPNTKRCRDDWKFCRKNFHKHQKRHDYAKFQKIYIKPLVFHSKSLNTIVTFIKLSHSLT